MVSSFSSKYMVKKTNNNRPSADAGVKNSQWSKIKIININTLKEREKRDMYLDLARELGKKIWKMIVMVVPIVIGALGTVTKGLVQGLEELGKY